MKKEEEIRLQNMKSPYIPPEMLIGLNTLSTTGRVWTHPLASPNQKFASTMRH